jgi:hypothetical protein
VVLSGDEDEGATVADDASGGSADTAGSASIDAGAPG